MMASELHAVASAEGDGTPKTSGSCSGSDVASRRTGGAPSSKARRVRLSGIACVPAAASKTERTERGGIGSGSGSVRSGLLAAAGTQAIQLRWTRHAFDDGAPPVRREVTSLPELVSDAVSVPPPSALAAACSSDAIDLPPPSEPASLHDLLQEDADLGDSESEQATAPERRGRGVSIKKRGRRSRKPGSQRQRQT